jgi:acyl-coenzyme A thioesterase PaaI-like protein
MNLTPLSSILSGRRQGGADVTFEIPQDWLQGRTSFGGLVSVFAVQAMRDVAAGSWPATVSLRALQTNFIAPVGEGPVVVTAQVLREGKNVRQVQATVKQRDEVCALMVGVFGSDRETVVPPLEPVQPSVPKDHDELRAFPFIPGTRPNFTAHLDMRWGDGAPPFTGTDTWIAALHLRLLDEDAASLPSEIMTVLMADASPTPVLSRFKSPTPASSVSWALELRPLSSGEEMDGWWRADNKAIAAAGGYVNQQSMLWAPSGALAALAYQVVTVYG